MSPMLLSIVIFVAVSAMVAAAIFAFRDFGNSKTEDRLEVLAGLKTPELEARGLLKEEAIKEGVQGLSGAVNRIASATFPLTTALYDSDSTAGAALPDHMLIDARLDGDGDPLTRSRSDPSARIDGVKRGDAPIRLVLTR